MMHRSTLLALAAATLVCGCKIVAKSDDPDALPQDDATRMAAMVGTDWQSRILPRILETAAPLADVLAAIETDIDAAREDYAVGTAPGNFVVRGEGQVTEASLDSRAARLDVDVTGDGEADVEIQLGPVIRGTALRDSLPFYQFTAFRDQIEFARLAGALNDAVHAGMPEAPAEPVGRTVAFTGVFAGGGADAAKEIVPVELVWSAP